MENLLKQFILTRLTPPRHVIELIEFVQENFEQGEISFSEYCRLLMLLDYDI
jgi:hypothetical protein